MVVAIFWKVTPCYVVHTEQSFEGTLYRSSQTLVPFYLITRPHISEDRNVNYSPPEEPQVWGRINVNLYLEIYIEDVTQNICLFMALQPLWTLAAFPVS
jgi:hypothetical protein